MKINLTQNLVNLEDWVTLKRYVAQDLSSIGAVLNGRVGLDENCDTSLVSVTFTATATDTAVIHTLNRVPTGFITVSPTAAMRIYAGTAPNTSTLVYVRTDAVGSAQLLVF